MSSKRKSRRKKSQSPRTFKKMPSKADVEKLARGDDRWTLLRHFMTRVPQGTRRFADVSNVGPVVDDCEMEAKTWDAIVAKRSTTGQCKGIFFAFYRTKKFRRCEQGVSEGDNLCAL